MAYVAEPWSLTLTVAVVAAVASALGALATWAIGRRTAQIDTANFAREWSRDLRDWASEVVFVLSDAASLCETMDSSESTQNNEAAEMLRTGQMKLSALIDTGRWFLPNSHRDEHGLENPSAYRGYRHPALDPLVASFMVIDGEQSTYRTRRNALIEMRRLFVSSIQEILGTADSNALVAGMVERYDEHGVRDKTYGGLIVTADQIPGGAAPLLNATHPASRATPSVSQGARKDRS